MKRLRSIDDLHSYGDKNACKDSNVNRSLSSSHRSFHYKSDNVRKGRLSSSSSSRYDRDRPLEEDREGSKMARKRSEHDFEGFDRRKGFDRYRENGESRGGYGGGGDRNLIYKSESFCGSRREYPKGLRSERDRLRREGGVSSWRKGLKDFCDSGRGSRVGLEDRAVWSPKGLRDMKSPTWSKDSESDQAKMKSSSPQWLRDAKPKSKSKSPTWSKDSESEQFKSEQSKSIEVKKSEELPAEIGSSSEMEEGELEPEPLPETETEPKMAPKVAPESEDHASIHLDIDQKEIKSECQFNDADTAVVERTGLSSNQEIKPNEGIYLGGKDAAKEADKLADLQDDPTDKMHFTENEIETVGHDDNKEECLKYDIECKENKEIKIECQLNDAETAVGERPGLSSNQGIKPNEGIDLGGKGAKKEADKPADIQEDPTDKKQLTENEIETEGCDENQEECLKDDIECKEEMDGANMDKPSFTEEENKQNKSVNLETRADFGKLELNDEVSTENEVPKEVNRVMVKGMANNMKDKGKNVSFTPTDTVHASEDGLQIDRGVRDLPTCSGDVMEGPRAFELFSRFPVRKAEKRDHSILNKQKDGSLAMEDLDLSLSLPNVLLPTGAPETMQVPGSPSQARSMQSLSNTFRTDSDGFTASMSFSGSQSFYHNPSCSLTQNSLDYEQSVGSRPLFQGIDQVSHGGWQGQSQNDPKQKEVPFGERNSMNVNGSFYQFQALRGILDGQVVKGQHSRVLEGSSKMVNDLDRQLGFHKQKRHEDVISPSQSVGYHDIGSSYSCEKKREMRDRSSGSLCQTTSQKEQEQLPMGGVDFVETSTARIVSEPVHAISRSFHEMTGQSIACLKEAICEIMLNEDKQGKIIAFQKVLQNRSDINLEVLRKCHHVQLEILVALKTGLTNFLLIDSSISSSDLAEIFLNLRCRNLLCRSQLPVDECDCKVCVQRNGFCRECMCLVCSKFDNASNTCSWVGCDVCLHWCHTDCGLRESYIRNGHSAIGSKGTTEMQFHCIACDHPSEMFGFVKEVFQNFAKEWSVETLCKELEYVKRIFSASKDMRGRQLHEIADQMLPRLANRSNLRQVFSHIMSFFADYDSSKLAMTRNFSGKEQVKENSGVAGPSQEAAWLKSVYSAKPPVSERPPNILPGFDQNDKRILAQELQMSVQKDFCFDELESIVKIKLAEAKMFQARADDARREAEGLKRIALAKNEKTEEEYASRIAKLGLTETKEMRKRKFEELQALERAHLEFFNLKMRMEADIKDLLSKMEATKRNPAM